jgi:uncharacterized membrane protein required for colicin V production
VHVVDIGIAVVALFAAVRGWRLGALGQVLSFLGRGAALLIALLYLPKEVARYTHHFTWWQPSLVIVGVLVCGSIGAFIGRLIARRMLKLLPIWKIELLDSAIGMTAGLVGVVAVCWLASGVLPFVPASSTVAKDAAHSVVLRDIARLLPTPPSFPTMGELIRNAHVPTSVTRLGQ